ncbi:MAG: ComEA family DNA-binding protein [Dehalococcoidia bacterium]|nr:ComEA family DNA-binding protein [Dehalococcoidia bacterium]
MKQIERLYLPAVVFLILAIAAGAGLLAYRATAGEPALEITAATPSPSAQKINVQVTGAVANPGVYSLQSGATLDDAVRAAGGAASDAALSHVNLARRARDGDQLHVPTSGEVPQKVDINTADAWLLEALPGIGEELANRIIDYRRQNGPFTRIEDLTLVKGISSAVYGRLKDRIAVN